MKKIENHPHRQDLQADLQQNNAYNPSSEKSKKMIKDMGSVELYELCETNPKTQCKECLSYWNQGIVHCICGHLLKESEASRGAIQCTLDLLSIPNYVIKKGRPHGTQYTPWSRAVSVLVFSSVHSCPQHLTQTCRTGSSLHRTRDGSSPLIPKTVSFVTTILTW